MKFWDSHMHTPLCRHAAGEPEEYARQGLDGGLRGITFTCHSPMPGSFWPQVRMSRAEFDTYQIHVNRARERFAGELEIRLGMESDFFPGTEEWMRELLESAPFHYVLGSVHYQGPEYRHRYASPSFDQEVATYFDLLAASAETGLFDALAHPDLIKNLSPLEWDPLRFANVIEPALDRIAATGVAMEINTSGRHKRFQEFNPGPVMLGWMAERGIPIVLGSDSHTPRRVGEAFDEAAAIARACGYESRLVFEHRRPTVEPLPLAGNETASNEA